MSTWRFTDNRGTFKLDRPDLHSYTYFPIGDENGVMSSITPELGGDSKTGQNSFLLEPVSADNLHNNRSSRNFWVLTDDACWSAAGVSAAQQAAKLTDAAEPVSMEAGILWQKITRISSQQRLTASITSFVPHTAQQIELMKVEIRNDAEESRQIRGVAAIPIYGRRADNIRDHRNVTSMLNRIHTTVCGVANQPTMTFDERGHSSNSRVYGVFGAMGNAAGVAGEEAASGAAAPEGFIPLVEDFIGEGGSLENPRPLMESVSGKPLPVTGSGKEIDGYECMGGLVFPKVTLQPGEHVSFVIALAYGDGDVDALEQEIRPLLTVSSFDTLLKESRAFWEETVNVSYQTGDPDFDNWMCWVNTQPFLRRIYGCSFLPHHDYGRGGRGWRDLWQDCLALLVMNPESVREQLLNNCSGVRFDGTNATIIGSGLGEFIADRNGIARVWMDHGMWPWLTVKLYLEQTGDYGLLTERTPYFKDRMILHGDGADEDWSPEQGSLQMTADGRVLEGSVLEHLLIENLTSFYDVGEHGHIRIRGADWNDALDMAAQRGESVAFTAMYAQNLDDIADAVEKLQEKGIAERIPLAAELRILAEPDAASYETVDQKRAILRSYLESCTHTASGGIYEAEPKVLAQSLRDRASWIRRHIRETEWIDGENGEGWYNGYYDNDGEPLEGYDPESKTANMMLTSQVFTVMAGVATDDQVAKIVRAADHYLCRPEVGGYRLNTDFHEIKLNMGRMFGFSYGQKENGSVFCHMATMFANALYSRGFAGEGYRVIRLMYEQVRDMDRAGIYPGIPEYINDRGRGVYHYLTGAGSWLMLTVLSKMYGVHGEEGDLVLDPKLLSGQFDEDGNATVQLTFEGRKLCIAMHRESGLEAQELRVRELYLDGNRMDGNRIPAAVLRGLDPKTEHTVKVTL